jgi:hypothetical protein
MAKRIKMSGNGTNPIFAVAAKAIKAQNLTTSHDVEKMLQLSDEIKQIRNNTNLTPTEKDRLYEAKLMLFRQVQDKVLKNGLSMVQNSDDNDDYKIRKMELRNIVREELQEIMKQLNGSRQPRVNENDDRGNNENHDDDNDDNNDDHPPQQPDDDDDDDNNDDQQPKGRIRRKRDETVVSSTTAGFKTPKHRGHTNNADDDESPEFFDAISGETPRQSKGPTKRSAKRIITDILKNQGTTFKGRKVFIKKADNYQTTYIPNNAGYQQSSYQTILDYLASPTVRKQPKTSLNGLLYNMYKNIMKTTTDKDKLLKECPNLRDAHVKFSIPNVNKWDVLK